MLTCLAADNVSGWAVKVLQYRGIAFVTYKSELSAQFAKEAMACQSLEGDEILNVRWATEDPNPVSKATEKRRLEVIGQELIQGKVDPHVIHAMRAVRALEDGDVLDEDGYLLEDGAGEETAEPEAKRRRIESASQPESEEPPQPTGLLSADTLESLKYFSQIRKQNGTPQTRPPPSPSGLGLADYGSDEED